MRMHLVKLKVYDRNKITNQEDSYIQKLTKLNILSRILQ